MNALFTGRAVLNANMLVDDAIWKCSSNIAAGATHNQLELLQWTPIQLKCISYISNTPLNSLSKEIHNLLFVNVSGARSYYKAQNTLHMTTSCYIAFSDTYITCYIRAKKPYMLYFATAWLSAFAPT